MFCGYAKTKTHRDWWITADPICDLGEFYRYCFNLENRSRIEIQKPKWGYHVIVTRKEESLINKERWEEKNDLDIIFEYNNIYKIGENHVWLDVYAPKLEEIRQFFGLPKRPEFPFHLTIGYIEHIYNLNWLNEQREKR